MSIIRASLSQGTIAELLNPFFGLLAWTLCVVCQRQFPNTMDFSGEKWHWGSSHNCISHLHLFLFPLTPGSSLKAAELNVQHQRQFGNMSIIKTPQDSIEMHISDSSNFYCSYHNITQVVWKQNYCFCLTAPFPVACGAADAQECSRYAGCCCFLLLSS